MMPILWENYSGSGLGLRIYIFRIFDSILQPMHDSGTLVYGERELRKLEMTAKEHTLVSQYACTSATDTVLELLSL